MSDKKIQNNNYVLQADDLSIIVNLCKLMNTAINHDMILETIMNYCTTVMHVEGVSMLLYEEKKHKLMFYLVTGDKSEKLKKIELDCDEGIAGWVFNNNRSVVCNDLSKETRFSNRVDNVLEFHTKSIVAVPMMLENKVVGVLELVNKKSDNGFSPRDLLLAEGIAVHIAQAMERIKLINENIAGNRFAVIGETVTGLAHYIKNVLTALKGSEHLIDNAINEQNYPMVERFWPIVNRSLDTISKLSAEMLEFSKNRKPEYSSGNINKLLSDIAEDCTEQAKLMGGSIEAVFDDTVPEFYFDPSGIHRCFFNLVSNALDACKDIDSPRVKVSSKKIDDNTVELGISDNGCGISKENIEKITTSKYFSTKGAKGTGLGLFVTRKIITEHNGQLDIKSDQGSGATFLITLPLLSSEPTEQ